MRKQSITRIGKEKTDNAHQIVQDALRDAATAATTNGAIDLLGEALIKLDRLLTVKSGKAGSSLGGSLLIPSLPK
jgi:ribosomal protein S7